jgi:hypothetical protein
MSELVEPVMPDTPISHVQPGITIREKGVQLATWDDMSVTINTAAESVHLSQAQFLLILKWGQLAIHSDWSLDGRPNSGIPLVAPCRIRA